MPTNIIAVYDQENSAQQAIEELRKSGCSERDVTFVAPRDADMSDRLSAWGVSQQDASTYAEAVRRGKSLVRARVPDESIDRIAGILVQRGARKLPEIRQELEQSTGSVQSATEEISVGKSQETSQVSARAKVTEQPVERAITLKEEKVRAESKPADRPLSPEEADVVFQEEGSVELSATREVPEVSKQARVTQEVKLSKESGERQETVRDTVRRKDVEIDRKTDKN